jgi:hypothetical protein
MTKTERVKRMRAIARQARIIARVPKNASVEIQHRIHTNILTNPPQGIEELYREGDDLTGQSLIGEVKEPPVLGECIHLAVWTAAGLDNGELADVVIGWMGTDTEPPLVAKTIRTDEGWCWVLDEVPVSGAPRPRLAQAGSSGR